MLSNFARDFSTKIRKLLITLKIMDAFVHITIVLQKNSFKLNETSVVMDSKPDRFTWQDLIRRDKTYMCV